MIYYDLLLALKGEVAKAVDELFGAAYANQTHSQDLLLINQHGSYSEMLADSRVRGAHHLSPYMIGPDLIGFAEATFYEFIDWYRQSHLLDKAEFEERIKHDEEAQKQEHLMLQIEQNIYLRFWEADMILKQLYQLSSLASGEAYDWHLNIPVHARARGESKHAIIREKIRDRVETICPSFYELVKENYKSQIRNAIAHSQFCLMGRTIRFLNHSSNPAAHAPLRGMNFDEWYETFHTTLLLHSEMIRAFKEYRAKYKERTLANGNRIEIRIVTEDGSESLTDLGVLHDRDEWIWHKNLNEEDLRQKVG